MVLVVIYSQNWYTNVKDEWPMKEKTIKMVMFTITITKSMSGLYFLSKCMIQLNLNHTLF